MCDYDRYVTQDVFTSHYVSKDLRDLSEYVVTGLHKIADYALIHEFHVMGPTLGDDGYYHATLLVLGDEDKGHGTSREKPQAVGI